MLTRPDNILDWFFPLILFNPDVNPSQTTFLIDIFPRSSLILMLTRPDNILDLYFPSIAYTTTV